MVKVKSCFFSVIFLLLLLGPPSPLRQCLYCRQTGFNYSRNYSPEKENNHIQSQNWVILQDKRGIIFVGNHGGVLEFDGISWRLISVTNNVVRSMAIDDTGTIYVGGKDEIGFLAPDAKGTLQYVSLLDRLADNQRNFSDVWSANSTKEGVYFRTSKYLFRWNSSAKRMKVWVSDSLFYASFTCRGKFFIQRKKDGLMQVVDDSLIMVPGGEIFAVDRIKMIVPYPGDEKKLLIGTSIKGFYLYDGIKTEPFPTGADDYLKEKQLYHGIRLLSSPGDFALATRLGGLVIIDARGRLKKVLTKSSGLLDDIVWNVFEDIQGNLWLALNKGIAKIEYNSPFTIYDDRLNLPSLVLSAVKHQNALYAGTTSGLYCLSFSAKFKPVPGISAACWSLLSSGDSVLAATSNGVFQVENNKTRLVVGNHANVLARSQTNTNRIWTGTQQGLVSLSLSAKSDEWQKERTLTNITQGIHTIGEDKRGNLWLGTLTQGVLKVDFPIAGEISDPVVTPYHTSHGLPPGEINIFMAADHAVFATEKGIFRFDEKAKVFIPDPTFGAEFADGSRGVFRIAEDKNKNIWIHSERKNIQAISRDGTFVLNKKPFLRIPSIGVNAIYPDPGGAVAWFASDEGLIRCDTGVKKNFNLESSTLIRKVSVSVKLVFDGYENKSNRLFPVFRYKDRNLRFDFAAPFFEEESKVEYRYFLEGYDEDWSAWTKKAQADYTNLDSGSYTFRVRAKNIYGHLSREGIFQFKVLPPWYKTWWAVSFYGFLFFLLVIFIVKWRSRRLMLEKHRLERIVKERTTEIEEKKRQLEIQSGQLKEMDKVKSRFFANISHEFRTPLTLIMGPLQQMLSPPRPGSRDSEKEQKKRLKLMLLNSQRLLNLINQLLELSRFDSGKMKLQAAPQNIISFVKGVTASFEMAAEENELDLQFHSQEEPLILYFDGEKMEKAMCNLLANALKFTPAGGRITVTVTTTTTADDQFPLGSLDIAVRNTGIDIPENQLSHIFDYFYQLDSSSCREHKYKGTGIGLALTRELVSLHHGEINVRSGDGRESGTEFMIRLPRGKAHLEPGEIVNSPGFNREAVRAGEIPGLYRDEDEKEEEEEEKEKEKGKDIEEEMEEKNILLLVEDSADVRCYVRESLEPLYTVVEAVGGQEGIEKAREIIPDLIISDIMMPGIDGYQLCRALKADLVTSHIPIILLTARAAEENVLQGLATGADDYITKPFNIRILCARIKNLIDLRSQFHMNLDREMTLQPAAISVSTIDKEFIKELKEVIEKNLSDPEFNVDDLGKKLYMSRTSIYRKIHALTGKPPSEFIRSYRLKRAAQLLKDKGGSVTEVAFEVGFSSRSYFTKCFKEKFQQLPSDYQVSEN
jgi:signal transduction histidine kinase/DNA-binding response OmpR family regulator